MYINTYGIGTSPSPIVSIPSQVGTLFGPTRPEFIIPMPLVSIPSQVGTLFGPGAQFARRKPSCASQYPLRWAPSSDHGPRPWRIPLPPSLNTLSGGHPLRTKHCATCVNRSTTGLNTLSGGHPLRTREAFGYHKPLHSVSIPSQVGTLFGPMAMPPIRIGA